MNKFLLTAILFFITIIIIEIIILFFRPSTQTSINSVQKESISPTPSVVINKIKYKPIRTYSGRVISFGLADNGYLYDLTYTNMENLKGSLYFNQEEANTATIQYVDNEEKIIEEKTGLDLETLKAQDRFDIIITDNEDDTLNPSNNSQELKVDNILFKIYQ